MSPWHLAQINIGRLVAPQGDPRVQPFFEALDRINALAEASPGFVWRLKDEIGNATEIAIGGDALLIPNMSVWTDADGLFEFVYRTAHTPVMAKRRDYFERPKGAYMALWWVRAGTIPTLNDGLSRLWLIDRMGPTPQAFTFKSRFPVPDQAGPAPIALSLSKGHQPDPWCVGNA